MRIEKGSAYARSVTFRYLDSSCQTYGIVAIVKRLEEVAGEICLAACSLYLTNGVW